MGPEEDGRATTSAVAATMRRAELMVARTATDRAARLSTTANDRSDTRANACGVEMGGARASTAIWG